MRLDIRGSVDQKEAFSVPDDEQELGDLAVTTLVTYVYGDPDRNVNV